MKIIFAISLTVALSLSVCAQDQADSGENVFQSSYREPLTILKKGPGHYFLDFGKDAFGTLSLLFTSEQSDSLVVHLGEKISENGAIDRNPGGTIRYQKVYLAGIPENKEVKLQLPPDKRNTGPQAIPLPDSFGVIMPFRYCEIENLEVPLEDVVVRQKIYHYRFNEDASGFESSDTILDAVWDLCKYSMKATSFCGIYIDGDRERIPYEADAYINQLSHYAVDREYQMALTNQAFAPGIDTVCLFTNLNNSYLSSSMIKEIASAGGDISSMAPAHVLEALQRKLAGPS